MAFSFKAIGCMAVCASLGVAGLAAQGFAQEHLATGAAKTDATWSSLVDQLTVTNARVTANETMTTRIKACGMKGMVFAPGKLGADGEGCSEATSATGTSITTVMEALTAINNSISSLNSSNAVNTPKLNALSSCAGSGMIASGSGCVAPKLPTCTLQSFAPTGGSFISKATCDGGIAVGKGTPDSAVICLKVVCK